MLEVQSYNNVGISVPALTFGHNQTIAKLQKNSNIQQVLLLLCEEQEKQDEEGANGGSIDSQATAPTIPSILLLDDSSSSSSSHDETGKRKTAHENRKTNVRERRGGRRETDDKEAPPFLPPSPTSERQDAFGAFVAQERVFQAILRQMRGGTSVSKETAARVRVIVHTVILTSEKRA